MSRDLPSLNAVRMFEAAAQHGNFTRAAEQLHVTQGAVSRQIKRLERDLNQTLFHRNGPKLELTDAGDKYYRAVQDALAMIRQSTTALKLQADSPTLSICVSLSFGLNWLMPRIGRFHEHSEGIRLQVVTRQFGGGISSNPNIDAEILCSEDPPENMYSLRLSDDIIFPVCSTEFQIKNRDLRNPRDLIRFPLLIRSDAHDQWSSWLRAANLSQLENRRLSTIYDPALLYRALIGGQGIALGRQFLLADDIASGRLKRLYDVSIPAGRDYYFACRRGYEKRTHIRSFLVWLRQELKLRNGEGKGSIDSARIANVR